MRITIQIDNDGKEQTTVNCYSVRNPAASTYESDRLELCRRFAESEAGMEAVTDDICNKVCHACPNDETCYIDLVTCQKVLREYCGGYDGVCGFCVGGT